MARDCFSCDDELVNGDRFRVSPEGIVFHQECFDRLHPDPVQTPEHYRWIPGVECIDVAQHFGYCLGNVIKYVWRADHKGKPIQDLEKALTYLTLELERRKAES